MIGRISGQYTSEALNARKAKRSFSYGNSYSQEADNADISSFGSLLARASSEFKNIPDIREDVVADFKAKINSGTYNPPLDKLANALYVAGMLDLADE